MYLFKVVCVDIENDRQGWLVQDRVYEVVKESDEYYWLDTKNYPEGHPEEWIWVGDARYSKRRFKRED